MDSRFSSDTAPSGDDAHLLQDDFPGELSLSALTAKSLALMVSSPFEIAQILMQVQYIPRETVDSIEIDSLAADYGHDSSGDDSSSVTTKTDYDDEGEDEGSWFDNDRQDHCSASYKMDPESESIQASFQQALPEDDRGYFLMDETRFPKNGFRLLKPLRGGVRQTIRAIRSHPCGGTLALYRGFHYHLVFELGRSILQPAVEGFLNEKFDLYDQTIIPLRLQSNFLPNMSTLVLSHAVSNIILYPFEYLRVCSIVSSRSQQPLEMDSYQALRNINRSWYTYPNFTASAAYFTLVPFLQNTTHLVLTRFLRLSVVSNPYKYALALWLLTCAENLITLPLETIMRRMWVNGGSGGGSLNGNFVASRRQPYKSATECLRSILRDEAIGYDPIKTGDLPLMGEDGKNRRQVRRKMKRKGWKSGVLGGISKLYRGFIFQAISNAVVCFTGAISGVDVDDSDVLYF